MTGRFSSIYTARYLTGQCSASNISPPSIFPIMHVAILHVALTKTLYFFDRTAVSYFYQYYFRFNAGRTKEALVNYKTALQLNPNHTVALVNMARHLRATGNVREAEQAYKRFVLRCTNTKLFQEQKQQYLISHQCSEDEELTIIYNKAKMKEALTTCNNPRGKQKRYFPWLVQGHKASIDRYTK